MLFRLRERGLKLVYIESTIKTKQHILFEMNVVETILTM